MHDAKSKQKGRILVEAPKFMRMHVNERNEALVFVFYTCDEKCSRKPYKHPSRRRNQPETKW